MRGEDGSRPGQLDRLGEGRAAGQVLPDPLDAEEAGMALVGVEDLGPRVPGDAQYSLTARTPPMPSSNSWRSR